MQQQIEDAIAAHFLRIKKAAEAQAAGGGTTEEEDPPPDRSKEVRKAADEGSDEKDNEQEPPQPSSSTAMTHVYQIGKAFLPQDSSYWVEKLRTARFSSSVATGILYRPKIADDLNYKVREVLERPLATGIILKGPQGVGKSHSLVNLLRKLLYNSNNQYLVTFIPDCEKWICVFDFVDAICASIGLSAVVLNLPITGNEAMDFHVLKNLISCVDGVLQSMGKQWVLIFDQINRLFSRPQFKECTDVGVLGFPFNWIKNVMKPGRITSVISASANNEIAYKERHEGFEGFEHETQMTEGEIIDLYSLKDQPRFSAESQVEEIDKLTGRVPLYVGEYLKFGGNVEQYESQVEGSVQDSLIALSRQDALTWQLIQNATIASLLGVPTTSHLYDKKFFLQTQDRSQFIYRGLIPQVKTASRVLLWDQLMKRIAEEEANLLAVCAKSSTRNSARGQHFEHIAIQRCLQHGVVASIDDVSIDLDNQTTHGFTGRCLPEMSTDGIYVPYNPQFPAVDMVLKKGNSAFGVQIHVNPHEDVITAFEGMCRRADWFDVYDNVYLVYLSPEEDVKALVAPLVDPAFHDVKVTRRSKGDVRICIIRRIALSRESIECLESLQWPPRCSIDSQ